ncbi:hypothetical protein AB0B30_34900 [Streptomyces narbonensis]|uniref:Uncharacterized protein n=1 Tax=Streptomyces narbonensis TaxID=67333 RepID=A0ABV3CC20_9ACTN
MTTKHSFRAEQVKAPARLIVAGVAVLAVALFGSVPASAAAGASKAQAGSYSSGPQAAARTGGASTVSNVAVAAGSRAGRSWRTYTIGVYPWLYCNYLGAYYQAYYAARGYPASFQCVYWGGVPPLHRGLLRVSLLV